MAYKEQLSPADLTPEEAAEAEQYRAEKAAVANEAARGNNQPLHQPAVRPEDVDKPYLGDPDPHIYAKQLAEAERKDKKRK